MFCHQAGNLLKRGDDFSDNVHTQFTEGNEFFQEKIFSDGTLHEPRRRQNIRARQNH